MSNQDYGAKLIKVFGGTGVLEVTENDIGGKYHPVYMIKFAKAVFVYRITSMNRARRIATP
jgi:hypothetical protein